MWGRQSIATTPQGATSPRGVCVHLPTHCPLTLETKWRLCSPTWKQTEWGWLMSCPGPAPTSPLCGGTSGSRGKGGVVQCSHLQDGLCRGDAAICGTPVFAAAVHPLLQDVLLAGEVGALVGHPPARKTWVLP